MHSHDQAVPILPSRSVAATVAFYRAIGFAGGPHEDNPTYAILRRGSIELHFFTHQELEPDKSFAGCYIRVAQVAPLYDAVVQVGLPTQGIPRLVALEDKPWGMREFAIIDPDGNLLRVGQPI